MVYAPVHLFLQIHSALKVITIYISESPASATTFKSLAVILYKLPIFLASCSLSSYLQLQSTYHSSISVLIHTSVYAVQRFTPLLLEKYNIHCVYKTLILCFAKHRPIGCHCHVAWCTSALLLFPAIRQ